MLRPIAEGLALFAELDLLPGKADVRAPVVNWLSILFARDQITSEPQSFDSIFSTLAIDARTTEAGFLGKENLVAQPLSISAGGYLPGYLTIKSLWNEFRRSDSDLVDPELFLCFVRAWFYDDLELVSLLLAEGDDILELAHEISTHFDARIRGLRSINWAECMHDFHEAVRKLSPLRGAIAGSGMPSEMLQITPGLELDRHRSELGKTRLSEAVTRLYNPTDVPDIISRVTTWTFQLRDLVWLGGVRVQIKVNEHRRVVVTLGATPLFAGPALADGNCSPP